MAGTPYKNARLYAAEHKCTIKEAMAIQGTLNTPRLSSYFDRIAKAADEIDKDDEDLAFNLRKKISDILAKAYKDNNYYALEGVSNPDEVDRLHKLAKEVVSMFPLPKDYGRPDTSGLDSPNNPDWLIKDKQGDTNGESTADRGPVSGDTYEDDGGEGDQDRAGEVSPTEDL